MKPEKPENPVNTKHLKNVSDDFVSELLNKEHSKKDESNIIIKEVQDEIQKQMNPEQSKEHMKHLSEDFIKEVLSRDHSKKQFILSDRIENHKNLDTKDPEDPLHSHKASNYNNSVNPQSNPSNPSNSEVDKNWKKKNSGTYKEVSRDMFVKLNTMRTKDRHNEEHDIEEKSEEKEDKDDKDDKEEDEQERVEKRKATQLSLGVNEKKKSNLLTEKSEREESQMADNSLDFITTKYEALLNERDFQYNIKIDASSENNSRIQKTPVQGHMASGLSIANVSQDRLPSEEKDKEIKDAPSTNEDNDQTEKAQRKKSSFQLNPVVEVIEAKENKEDKETPETKENAPKSLVRTETINKPEERTLGQNIERDYVAESALRLKTSPNKEAKKSPFKDSDKGMTKQKTLFKKNTVYDNYDKRVVESKKIYKTAVTMMKEEGLNNSNIIEKIDEESIKKLNSGSINDNYSEDTGRHFKGYEFSQEKKGQSLISLAEDSPKKTREEVSQEIIEEEKEEAKEIATETELDKHAKQSRPKIGGKDSTPPPTSLKKPKPKIDINSIPSHIPSQKQPIENLENKEVRERRLPEIKPKSRPLMNKKESPIKERENTKKSSLISSTNEKHKINKASLYIKANKPKKTTSRRASQAKLDTSQPKEKEEDSMSINKENLVIPSFKQKINFSKTDKYDGKIRFNESTRYNPNHTGFNNFRGTQTSQAFSSEKTRTMNRQSNSPTNKVPSYTGYLKMSNDESQSKGKVKKQTLLKLLRDPSNPYSTYWTERYLDRKFDIKLEFKKFINGYPIFRMVKNTNKSSSSNYVNTSAEKMRSTIIPPLNLQSQQYKTTGDIADGENTQREKEIEVGLGRQEQPKHSIQYPYIISQIQSKGEQS